MSNARSWSGGPWSAAAGWTIGLEALATELWLYAYSFPAPSFPAEVVAAIVTLVAMIAAIGWAAGWTRPTEPEGDAGTAVVGATTVAVVMALAAASLCSARAPMWIRLGEAMPQMLWLAHRAQPQSLSGATAPASAGTYHFSDVYRSASGFVEFDSDVPGILQTASYIYSPGSDPRSRDVGTGFSDDYGIRYRHLVGPWWAATADVPGA